MTIRFDQTSRLRFAPSPTGDIHVGNVRAALYNWLLARQCGGTFILRIEDTDRERSTDESTRGILEGLRWVGLDWDEGPYIQSERNERHQWAIDQTLATGWAYRCFCSPERLEALRKQMVGEGSTVAYDGACRDLPAAEIERRVAAGEPGVVRFRIPPGRAVEFEDMIGGPRRFETENLGDFVIRRTDGSPIFHLTVVVDDHDMGVTHIIRGDDHLSNTPRQILLFEALGWPPPQYGHLPMIQGPDRARLSKRHGSASLLAFRREGFLPEALINYLALLGWSFDDSTELMTRQELIERFSLERVNHSPAVFDRDKLTWMNGVYLRGLDRGELARRAGEYFIESGVPAAKLDEYRLEYLAGMEQERSRTLKEMLEKLNYFFADHIAEYEPAAARKHFLVEGAVRRIEDMETELAVAPNFEAATLDAALRELAEKRSEKLGSYAQPLRLAVTGRSASPGISEVLSSLGRHRVLARLREARLWIQSHAAASGSVS